jgi:hypothetical protein
MALQISPNILPVCIPQAGPAMSRISLLTSVVKEREFSAQASQEKRRFARTAK